MATLLDEISPSAQRTQEFETGWTAIHPMPTIADPNNPDGPDIPEYPSVKAHFRAWLINLCLIEEQRGYNKIAKDSGHIVNDLD